MPQERAQRGKWVAWGLVAILGLFNVEVGGGQTCKDCLSHRGWRELRLGVGRASLPIWPRVHSDAEPSHYARDFGLTDHEHRWRGGGSTTRMLFGLVPVEYACGGMDRGWASMAYENDQALRTLVAGKMGRGELSRQDLDALVLVETDKQSAEVRALQDALLDELVAMP
ncbi:MAG: hypothetical protein HOV80_38740 [Polyangiaceae bacterium]|nr:hypothetical protein [Polyangiaceae bacterium]